jgi:hypothetical protein
MDVRECRRTLISVDPHMAKVEELDCPKESHARAHETIEERAVGLGD